MLISSIGEFRDPQLLPAFSHTPMIAVSSAFVEEIAAAYTSTWSNTPSTPVIAYLSLSCGLNVYLTVHIVCHMVQLTGRRTRSRDLCNRIASMFVQSALLYLVPTLVFVILCAQRSLAQNLLFPIVCQIQASFASCPRAAGRPRLMARWIICSLFPRYSWSCG